MAHVTITGDMVSKALMSQSAAKAPGPDKIDLQI